MPVSTLLPTRAPTWEANQENAQQPPLSGDTLGKEVPERRQESGGDDGLLVHDEP